MSDESCAACREWQRSFELYDRASIALMHAYLRAHPEVPAHVWPDVGTVSAWAAEQIEAQVGAPRGLVVDRDAELMRELRAYLDTLTITSETIGDIRRSLFMPWSSQWNGWVRDETAIREWAQI